jgi:hypothetical protein
MKFPQQFIPISTAGNHTDAPVILHVLLVLVCVSLSWDAVRLIWNVYPSSKREFRESMRTITGWKPLEHVFFSINTGKLAIQRI